MVPFQNIQLHHQPRREEFLQAIGEVIDAGAFAGGPFVERFEQDFAAYCGVSAAVGVGSGTEALWLTLLALGIGPGDEVVTVPMSFAATVEAIWFTGAKPVFVDIDARTYTMNPAALERVLTRRTKAIIPVHLFGHPADMDPILAIAGKHGLRVIEDAAQAHGAEYKGRKVGSLADAACFSFYPGKNLGAFGEGGVVVTDDRKLVRKLRMLRDHGQSQKNRHSLVGWNSRLDGIQAAVLGVKLRHLDLENQQRRDHALCYDRGLASARDVIPPVVADGGRHVFHIYAIRVSARQCLLSALADAAIGCGVHYPTPIHLQPAYRALGHQRGDFPVAEQCADEFVSLPMFPGLTPGQISLVTGAVSGAGGLV
ncbi:MAG: DegT/DnrJ/EryC1/StrS family aminotransferase [Verrucomicrobiota bacterium]